jgi:hypothetical protein
MSTTNTEYLQVWQQVRQWPVDLRQSLAEEIVKSVESDLLPSNGPWDEVKNARRFELVDREIQGSISEAEKRELESLTRQLRLHRRAVAPIPLKGAQRLHREIAKSAIQSLSHVASEDDGTTSARS